MDVSISDKIILSALSQGNEEAFDMIFERLYAKMKDFATRLCGSECDAENIVQDIFMQLWINRENLVDVDNLDGYVFMMVRNAGLNFLRKSLRYESVHLEDTLQMVEEESAGDTLYYKELEEPYRRTLKCRDCRETRHQQAHGGISYFACATRSQESNALHVAAGITCHDEMKCPVGCRRSSKNYL